MRTDSSPNPPNEEDRRILAKAIFRLFDQWQLSEADQLALLGFSADNAEALATMRRTGVLLATEHLADRTRALLRIYRYLGMLYPEHPQLAKKWMTSANPRLEGEAPIQRIVNRGAAGIRFVTTLLEEQLF